MPTTSQGRTVGGRYLLLEPLGRGGMGTVWAARDQLLARDVAVKEVVPPPELTGEQRGSMRERTLREARAAARIRSASAVTVYDVVEEDGRPWIVMELLVARTLAHVVRDEGPLSPQRTALVGLRLLDALEAAHAAGVLHRDVKPANVMIGDDGSVVLTDFGIASLEGDPSVTATGMVVGSPAYMAPERARSMPSTAAADLWSLGATLYTAVEGRSPFEREGQIATLTAVLTDEPFTPRRAGGLRPLLEGLLEKDPALRLSAAAARGMLQAVADSPAAETAARQPASPPGSARDQELEHTTVFASPVAPASAAPLQKADPPQQAVATPVPLRKRDPDVQGPAAGARPTAAPLAHAASAVAPSGPASQPKPNDARRPGGSRRGRAAALVAALMLLVGGGGGWWLVTRDGSGPASRTASPSTSGGPQARSSVAPTPVALPDSAPTVESASDATPSPARTRDGEEEEPEAAVPAGFTLHEDDTGFSLAIPDGWERERRGTSVYFREPSGRRYLQVDQTDEPKPDAADAWRANEPSVAGRLADYERVRLEPTEYRGWQAADWEFTWQADSGRLRVLNRGFVVDGDQAYALLWSVPEDQWEDGLEDFEVFARTFEPAP
jgi:hypothetical protein